MNAPLRQAERLGRLTTTLGRDVLVLLRFDGSDHLNDLFEYRIEALATRNDLDFDALIGTHATVEIEGREGIRSFDGIVTQARWAGVGENGHRYDLVLRPWFWLAGRRRNQRIFHNKTVVQILEELLKDYAGLGVPALDIQLSKDYPVLEYTVQYRESDLDFARRQMERHGISFHFRHQMGSHTLVLTDDVLAHETVGERPYKNFDGHHQAEGEHFWEWAPERNLTTGAVRLTDYNFKKPTAAMEVDRLGDAAYEQGQIESFDYPGDYLAQDVGKIVAGLRTNQERGADRRNSAIGDCISLGAGNRVTLSGDPVPGTGETYLCLSAGYNFVSEAYGSGERGSDGYSFTGSYTLMPDTAPMAPPRRTHVPTVQGPQTAVVVGEGEIDCDEYGRILVRFHWDLDGAHSMRCRVSQNWAGNGWGGMVIPRIGMEVLVEFLEGDPDKPMVTGCVYNGKNAVPYDLPANKTRSTFRTDTHQGKGYNELRFEDENGREEIFVHAQKDRNEKTLNNHSERIDHNWVQSVGNHKVIEVDGSHEEAVHGSMMLHVGRSGRGKVLNGGDRSEDQGIGAVAANLPVTGLQAASAGLYSLFADAVISESTPGIKSQFIGVTKTVNVGNTLVEQAGNSIQLVSGSQVTIDAADVIGITSGSELRIQVGKSELWMSADGFTRLTGHTLFLEFENGVEIVGGKEIIANAPKIKLN